MSVWRVRMNHPATGEDVSKQAWERGEVGVWYGAWSAEDFHCAMTRHPHDPGSYLSALPRQQELGWSGPVPASYVDTVRRLVGIGEADVVLVFFDQTLHLARASSELRSHTDHPLNREGELFKYRLITDKRTFKLNQLPDVFRLVPSAGRSNVHRFTQARKLVDLLGDSADETDLNRRISAIPFKEWLDMLGWKSWESLCLGYLILQEGFVPTGLAVGHTLAVFDIVGRSREGARVLAQCKKNPQPVRMDADFVQGVTGGVAGKAYYFAYGGCLDAPDWVHVVSREDILRWGASDPGRWYLQAFRAPAPQSTLAAARES